MPACTGTAASLSKIANSGRHRAVHKPGPGKQHRRTSRNIAARRLAAHLGCDKPPSFAFCKTRTTKGCRPVVSKAPDKTMQGPLLWPVTRHGDQADHLRQQSRLRHYRQLQQLVRERYMARGRR